MKEDPDSKAPSATFDLSGKTESVKDEQLKQMGVEAEKELEEFLNKKPELRKFQKKIDRLMIDAGSFDKRMTVLGIMMEANLKELKNQLTELSEEIEKLKKL